MSEEQIKSVVVEQGVSSPHLPNINHRLQLLKDLKNQIVQYFPASNILLQVAPLVQDNVEELRKAFLARTEISVPLQILQVCVLLLSTISTDKYVINWQAEQADILAQAVAKKYVNHSTANAALR